MLDQNKKKTTHICNSLFIVLGILLISAGTTIVRAQAPTATPEAEENTYNGYRVRGVVEGGFRWRSLNGSENQYKSTLNYGQGFRSFDSNILLESVSGKGKYFDSLFISNSGWGTDPSGYLRVNMEKTGIYKFTSNFRKVNYFNSLSSFTAVPDPNQHKSDTKNTMGDFDITFLPQNERLRINVGTSFSNYTGPGTWNMRWNGDEFMVNSDTDKKSTDFRIGAEGKLAGFDWNLSEGYRLFKDRTVYSSTGNAGNNPTNTTAIASFAKTTPTEGNSYYTQFNLHRNWASKLDFTGRVIYATTTSNSSYNELDSGRDGSNNFIDRDQYTAVGYAKRPQTRADFGLTYNVTDNFRISETFTFDQFNVNGSEVFTQDADRRSAAGVPLSPTVARSSAYRVDGFRRLMNTLEGDYQFNNRVSAHVGWRYSERRVRTNGYARNDISGVVTYINTPAGLGEEKNSTNAFFAGMRVKPVKHWTLYWDVEHGSADNVFGRLENYDYTNFRVRSKYVINKFSFDLSVLTKNNSNPTVDSAIAPSFGFTPTTNIKSRFYNGTVNWDPNSKVSVSGGYTYRTQDSFTPVIFPYQACTTPACTAGTSVWANSYSQFLMHDTFWFAEIAATPVKRVTLYATYRRDKDTGEDGVVSPIIPLTFPPPGTGVAVYKNIIGGYPMTFTQPEFRVAFRLTHNIDWNVGYQYYKYEDVHTPSQNYTAHLPFTSLRIYFGGGVADR
ncbi:hypothetical protein BH10ACI3_BH10ACI3_22470 [soil metagenome]